MGKVILKKAEIIVGSIRLCITDCGTYNYTVLYKSAIHQFCKYAPQNDRLSEQIHNKFN